MILNAIRGDKTTLSLPVDLGDDADITFMVKRGLLDADDDAVISQSGLTVEEGVVEVVLTPEETDQFVDAERLYWDLQFDDGVGGVTTPLMGTLVIRADVTRTASETS